MELQEFVKNFELQFDEVEENSLTPETEFRNIEEWSSLNALLIIAMVNSEYGVTLTGDELKNSKTVGDIFNVIKGKNE